MIFIKHAHNHLINCADVLRHRRPTEKTKEKVLELYAKGHSPSSALNMIKYDLQEEYGDEYYLYAADGSICPSSRYMFYLYDTTFSNRYGAPDGVEMLKSLETFIQKYNEECGTVCAKLDTDISKKQVRLAVCTPLMRRVHENLKSSGEIMFVDASGTIDRHGSRVFIFLAPSLAGGLPLGILILFSESEDEITKGLEVLKSILPEKAFFGRSGPGVIMTDDSDAERNSLKSAFITAVLILCKFHILQALWRYLLNSQNGVLQTDRQLIFEAFRKLFFCKTVQDAEKEYNKFMANEMLMTIVDGEWMLIVKKYPKVFDYLKNLWSRKKEWLPASIKDQHLITRGHSTNNLSEANFRIVKDKIMERLKAFSLVQLFDFLTTKYDAHFIQVLGDFLSNRSIKKKRYWIPKEKTKNLIVTKCAEDVFLVTNTDK